MGKKFAYISASTIRKAIKSDKICLLRLVYFQCSEVPGKGADCSEWKDLNFWPQKNVEIGPFRIISREKLDRNITSMK